MLRSSKVFMIATAIVFLSVVPAISAQADTPVPPSPVQTLPPKDPSLDVSPPPGTVPLPACEPSAPCGPVPDPDGGYDYNESNSPDESADLSSDPAFSAMTFVTQREEIRAAQSTIRTMWIVGGIGFVIMIIALWVLIAMIVRIRRQPQFEDEAPSYTLMPPL